MSALPENCDSCGYCSHHKTSCTEFHCTHQDAAEDFHGVDKMVRHKDCPLEEDVLSAKRYRVQYRGEKFYVVIALKYGQPWEVFAEHPTNSNPSLTYMMAGWDAVTRMTTMSLKKYKLVDVIKQLKRASRQPSDLPGILAWLLKKFSC